LETRFGLPLRWIPAGTKFNLTMKQVDDRPRYFLQRLRTKNRWFGLSPGRVTSTDGTIERLSLSGTMYGGGELFHVLGIVDPEQSFEVHESLLVELGDALEARFSAFLPCATEMRLRFAHKCVAMMGSKVFRYELPDRMPEEDALPVIYESYYTGLHPLQPHNLGWINYWSQEVCDYLGFPQNLQGSPFLDACYRTPRGAWIVKFGDEPFAPRNVKHLEVLREMYERFPRVAIRHHR
jgi:hypothetical protein